MSTAAIPPGLPGISAGGVGKVTTVLFGAVVLVGFVPLALLQAFWSGERGGHLPWPVLQWALTTPVGALLLMALCTLVLAPALVLHSLWPLRQALARAIDITGLPPVWGWPGPWPTYPRSRRYSAGLARDAANAR